MFHHNHFLLRTAKLLNVVIIYFLCTYLFFSFERTTIATFFEIFIAALFETIALIPDTGLSNSPDTPGMCAPPPQPTAAGGRGDDFRPHRPPAPLTARSTTGTYLLLQRALHPTLPGPARPGPTRCYSPAGRRADATAAHTILRPG